MQMMSVYVLVLINDKGLISVAHLFDILLCDGRELLIGDFIIGMRVQGNMNNGLLRARKSCIQAAISCPPSAGQNTLFVSNILATPSFTFSPLYANAPYKELP